MLLIRVAAFALALLAVSCAKSDDRGDDSAASGHNTHRVKIPAGYRVTDRQKGEASWYGGRWHGRRTASGERFDQHAQTAAHRKLPFGTMVRVTRPSNGAQTLVRITDRGPFTRGRVIDLSHAAADQLDMIGAGVAPVELEVLEKTD